MPHMTVEYTNNLQGIDEVALMAALTNAVCDHPTVADEADVKARIAALSNYQIGHIVFDLTSQENYTLF